MMLAFCCSLASTLDAVRRLAERSAPEVAAAAARARHVGYQDDQYFRSSLREFLLYEPVLLAAFESDGHELQLAKSKVWIPALDAVETCDAPEQARALWGRYGRARYGFVALGSSGPGGDAARQGRHCGLRPCGGTRSTGGSGRASRA